MNPDHQVDEMDFDKNDKSKPNGMYSLRILKFKLSIRNVIRWFP